MGQTLDYNVKLSDRQQTYARLAAKTLERNTFLHNIEEKIVEKRYEIIIVKLGSLVSDSHCKTLEISNLRYSQIEISKRDQS